MTALSKQRDREVLLFGTRILKVHLPIKYKFRTYDGNQHFRTATVALNDLILKDNFKIPAS